MSRDRVLPLFPTSPQAVLDFSLCSVSNTQQMPALLME